MSADVLIVEARYHGHVSDALLDGATAALDAAGIRFERIAVPGALEIPAAILFAARAGEGAGKSYDGYVALGCVIRDEANQCEIILQTAARGLGELALQHGLCIGQSILSAKDEEHAFAMAARDGQDKGGDAARACVAMIHLKSRFGARR